MAGMMVKDELIRTPRLVLRPVLVSDINETYVSWLNDPDVNTYLETRHNVQTKDSLLAYWKTVAADPKSRWLAICLADDMHHIGNIRLGEIDWRHKRAEISLFLGEKKCWGKGLASEAIAYMTNWALSSLGLKKVTAWIYSGNTASRRAFEKAGYVLEGTITKYVVYGDTRTDAWVMGICSKEI